MTNYGPKVQDRGELIKDLVTSYLESWHIADFKDHKLIEQDETQGDEAADLDFDEQAEMAQKALKILPRLKDNFRFDEIKDSITECASERLLTLAYEEFQEIAKKAMKVKRRLEDTKEYDTVSLSIDNPFSHEAHKRETRCLGEAPTEYPMYQYDGVEGDIDADVVKLGNGLFLVCVIK